VHLGVGTVACIVDQEVVVFARVEGCATEAGVVRGVDVVTLGIGIERTWIAQVVDGRTQLAVGELGAEVSLGFN
jgi:hypothetical protein